MWKILGGIAAGSSGIYLVRTLSAQSRNPDFQFEFSPSSPEDLNLQSVQVFFRHGARTPLQPIPYLKEAEWPKDKLLVNPSKPYFPYILEGLDGKALKRSPHDDKFQALVFKGGAFAGQLTKLGKEQMWVLGRRLRRDYIDRLQFLDPIFDESLVYIRSTNILRTVESAQWLVSGMFDVESSENTKPIVIFAESDEQEILYPNFGFCRALRIINKRFFKAVDDIPGIEKHRLKVSSVLNYNGESNNSKKLDYQELRDELSSRIAHGIHVPIEVLEMLHQIDAHAIEMLKLVVSGADESNRQEVLGLSVGPVLQMISDNMDATVKGTSKTKFYLYSAHDSTIMSFLLSLGIFDGKWPPYTADLRFELYEDKKGGKWVRVLYVGTPQRLHGANGAEFISLDRFKKIISPYAMPIEKYREVCSAPGEEEEAGEVMDVIGGTKKQSKK